MSEIMMAGGHFIKTSYVMVDETAPRFISRISKRVLVWLPLAFQINVTQEWIIIYTIKLIYLMLKGCIFHN